MERITISFIMSLCSKFEHIACKSTKSGKYNRTIRFIKALSFIRYRFYLGYKNDFIEDQILTLANQIEKRKFNYNGEKTIVVIDEINADYIGLMLQYIEGLISGSYKILYLYEQKEHPMAVRTHLLGILQQYMNARIRQIPPKLNGLSKSQWIYDEVCAFGSDKVLMNFGEWAIEECIACSSLPRECYRYRINAADHCFWAGASCVDYIFEFRHYGANLTIKERGLSQGQVINLPYYPVMNDIPFAGFPHESKSKFIFLSGGSIYKIVDKERTFFRLCKSILDNCPDSIVLFAGAEAGDSVLSDGIRDFELQDRFIPIGYRNDIVEVFKHCDVFLDTYPMGGALMCQFAAHCSKPIINFKFPGVEECVAQKRECSFTYYTEKDFVQEAIRLHDDAIYREERGSEMHDAVVSRTDFEHALLSFLSTGIKVFETKWKDDFTPRKLKVENTISFYDKKTVGFYYKMFILLGSDFVIVMPGKFFSLVFHGIIGKLKRFIGRL